MRRRLGFMLIVLCACSGDEGAGDCSAGEIWLDGACVPASSCSEPSVELADGSCAPVGALESDCADGFGWTAGVCEPLLPAEPCDPGQLAVIGEPTCQPIMDCPVEPWGGIEPGEKPQWVDGSYGGNDSDGSQARPWTTVTAAIAAAEFGATIGIAPGSYVGNLEVQGKALHLRGICPSEVEIVGVETSNDSPAVVLMGAAASGTSIAGLAVTGPSVGIAMSGAVDIRIERTWIHDTGEAGLDVEDPLGAAAAVVADSLIERCSGLGVLMLGSALTLERTVVRDTVASAGTARGVTATASDYTGAPADLTLDRAVLSSNAGLGLLVVGSAVQVDASVIRGTLPAEGSDGEGLSSQVDLSTGERAHVSVTRSALLDNHLAGAMAFGSLMRLESSVVRGTLPQTDPATGQVLNGGRGINVQDDVTGDRTVLEVVRSTLDENRGIGLFTAGSDVTIEDALIRGAAPGADEGGRGLNLQPSAIVEAPSAATVRRTLIDQSHELAVLVGGSQLTMEDCSIRQVAANASGYFGDGIAVLPASGQLNLIRTAIEGGERAALSVFGGEVTLSASRLWCFPIDMAVQNFEASTPRLHDAGDNRCGCLEEVHDCRAADADLQAPTPVGEL